MSDANVMLDSTILATQLGGSSIDMFEDPVRERFKAAAAVAPRFLLLDFRYYIPLSCRSVVVPATNTAEGAIRLQVP